MELTWGPGRVIAGRYRLVSQLGQGGMGSVWRADHIALSSPVAIKIIDPEIGRNREMLERFQREAQASAALRSPHVVQILDYGVDENIPYIAMELLDGESLGDRLGRVTRLPYPETARFIGHVARALAKAHEQGVVHRDLKPDNIFIVKNEDAELAKVLDFGIAKVTNLGPGSGKSNSTRTGSILGTPSYMSPEQAQGVKTLDGRSDLWSLAIIAFQCVCGRVPFESEALGDLLIKICIHPIPVPSQVAQVPRGFDEWFARATQRDPNLRFQTAKDLAEALRLVLVPDGSGASFSQSGPYSPAVAVLGQPPPQGTIGAAPLQYGAGSTPWPPPGAVTPVPGEAQYAGTVAMTMQSAAGQGSGPHMTTAAPVIMGAPAPARSNVGAIVAVAVAGLMAMVGLLVVLVLGGKGKHEVHAHTGPEPKPAVTLTINTADAPPQPVVVPADPGPIPLPVATTTAAAKPDKPVLKPHATTTAVATPPPPPPPPPPPHHPADPIGF